MSFMDGRFLIFLLLFTVVYYAIPKNSRYIAIAIGSLCFYGFADPKVLVALFLSIILTYIGGILIEKKLSQGSKGIYALFFALNVGILIAYKYSGFILQNINRIANFFVPGRSLELGFQLMLPIGLSFYVFQSCSYLGDVYKRNIPAEKNILKYTAFVAFFPTILMGPIQKARNLLPQINSPRDFEFDRAYKGTLLILWGYFEKILVANNLAAIINNAYAGSVDLAKTTAYYMTAAISFSLYIYADFSAYSDIARGISKILGFEIERNFNNPYSATSLTEFWRRWHVSLNEWFTEYIYIPLGGNRKGTARKYFNMFTVFFLSGLWHGAEWHYVFWGVINGLLVILGQILNPFKKKIMKKMGLDKDVESVFLLKRIIVFLMITFTWIFFRNGTAEGLSIIRHITVFPLIRLFVPDLLMINGSYVQTFISILFIVVFCIMQTKRQNKKDCYDIFVRQPAVFQWLSLACMICVCIFGACSGSVEVNTQFLYFEF